MPQLGWGFGLWKMVLYLEYLANPKNGLNLVPNPFVVPSIIYKFQKNSESKTDIDGVYVWKYLENSRGMGWGTVDKLEVEVCGIARFNETCCEWSTEKEKSKFSNQQKTKLKFRTIKTSNAKWKTVSRVVSSKKSCRKRTVIENETEIEIQFGKQTYQI
jgi:hypothetical protein